MAKFPIVDTPRRTTRPTTIGPYKLDTNTIVVYQPISLHLLPAMMRFAKNSKAILRSKVTLSSIPFKFLIHILPLKLIRRY